MKKCFECGGYFVISGKNELRSKNTVKQSLYIARLNLNGSVVPLAEKHCCNCGVVQNIKLKWTWWDLYDSLVKQLIDDQRLMGGECLPTKEIRIHIQVRDNLFIKKRQWGKMKWVIKRDWLHLQGNKLENAKEEVLQCLKNNQI